MLHHYYSGGAGHHQDVAAAGSPGDMASSTFSLFFPMSNGQCWPPSTVEESAAYDDHSTVTTSPSSPSSSSTGSVDCTLSLGTPSSRRAEPVAAAAPAANHGAPVPAHYPSLSAATVSWDATAESYYCGQQGRPATGAAKCAAGAGHDALLDRRCANCGTASTPLWRNGPRGPKSLCNACGIRYKKEERRAAATTTTADGAAGCGFITAQRGRGSTAAKAAPAVTTCGEETSPYVVGGGGGEVADAAYLAWRLNVVPPAATATAFSVWPERASLYHYN
ncbi:GATA transcription factor 15 [Oryza glaberrima]|uniref:GATA-type domain-containing protein n=1 Tax=Oryza glaberrima TaxID=4538 RepID=I1PY89_ORYGL|nr:GATA transcription factor 15 [Oryza glaberrima]